MTTTKSAASPAEEARFARAFPHPADPPLGRDGRCVVCRKERKPPKGAAGSNLAALEQAPLDPFCSTVCCREWHGCQLATTTSAWNDEETAERLRAGITHRMRPQVVKW